MLTWGMGYVPLPLVIVRFEPPFKMPIKMDHHPGLSLPLK